jgi:hypothetical protein
VAETLPYGRSFATKRRVYENRRGQGLHGEEKAITELNTAFMSSKREAFPALAKIPNQRPKSIPDGRSGDPGEEGAKIGVCESLDSEISASPSAAYELRISSKRGC